MSNNGKKTSSTYLAKNHREGLIRFAARRVAKRSLQSDLGQEFLESMDLASGAARSAIQRSYPILDMKVLDKYNLITRVSVVSLYKGPWIPLIPDPRRIFDYWMENGPMKRRHCNYNFMEDARQVEMHSFFNEAEMKVFFSLHDEDKDKRIHSLPVYGGVPFKVGHSLQSLPDHVEALYGYPIPNPERRGNSLPIFFGMWDGPAIGAQWEMVHKDPEEFFNDEEKEQVKTYSDLFKALKSDMDQVFCAYKALIFKKRTFEDLIKVWSEVAEYVDKVGMELTEGCPVMSVKEAEERVAVDLEQMKEA